MGAIHKVMQLHASRAEHASFEARPE